MQEKPAQHPDVDNMIADLCSERPALHVDGDRNLADYGIDHHLASFLRSNLSAGQRSIETGSGISTIVFLLLGTKHTAVSPDEGEPERIRSYCEEHNISLQHYSPVVAASETFLPTLEQTTPFDLALVDGNHAFPAPCIDWFYLTRVLRKGGIMVVDDTQLWPCRVLADFLDAEEVWQQLVRTERVATYRLLAEPSEVLSRWWGQQPDVMRHSKPNLWARVSQLFFGR